MTDKYDSMDDDECGMSEMDEYVERRFELTEKLHRMNKDGLIRIINKMMDFADGVHEMDLSITDDELVAIIELVENEEQEEDDE